MMGMRAFVWFWVMVSFYGAFFLPNQSSSALNSTLLVIRKRGVWSTIEAVKGCV